MYQVQDTELESCVKVINGLPLGQYADLLGQAGPPDFNFENYDDGAPEPAAHATPAGPPPPTNVGTSSMLQDEAPMAPQTETTPEALTTTTSTTPIALRQCGVRTWPKHEHELSGLPATLSSTGALLDEAAEVKGVSSLALLRYFCRSGHAVKALCSPLASFGSHMADS